MSLLWSFVVYFSALCLTAEAQNCTPVTPAIIGSIFGTAAVILVILLLVFCIYKQRDKKARKLTSSVPGYDNPLVIADNDDNKQNGHRNGSESKQSPQPIQMTSLDEGKTSDKPQNSEDTIRTFLLDQKNPPTNGFDVLLDKDGDIVVTNVRANGPANKKLKEGDVIESITVFFDNIEHEEALRLLSNSAPHKVAVTISTKIKETKKLEEDVSDIGPLYSEVEKEIEEKLHSSTPVVERKFPIYSVIRKPKPADTSTKLSVGDEPDDKENDSNNPFAAEPRNIIAWDDTSSSNSSSQASSLSEEVVTILQPEKPVEDLSQKTDEAPQLQAAPTENPDAKEKNLHESFAFIDAEKRSSSVSSRSSSDENSFQVISDPVEEPLSPTSSSDFDKVLDADFIQKDAMEDLHVSPRMQDSDSETASDDEKDRDTSNKPDPLLRALSAPVITPSKKREDIVFMSGWRRAVKLLDLMKANLVNEDLAKRLEFGEVGEDEVAKDLHQYLSGKEPIAGIVMAESGTKMSLYEASQSGIIRRGTAVGLLEAQAATGNIISPHNGDKMTVDEAKERGLIDHQLGSVLIRAERAVLGFKTKLSDKPLSLFEAMEKKLVVESHGIRLLEAQIATGGIIDPYANHRLPVEVAFERGLFDHRLNRILEDPNDDTKGFFDPNTNENLTYLELLDRCVDDTDTSLKLLPIYSKNSKKQYLE